MKLQNLIHILMGIACIGLLPRAQAVSPPPPGGYPNFTTAAGDHALQALTLGLGNTAIGTFSLFSVTTGNFNTAVGAGSLDLNTADSNTATGAAALLFNTTGTENTANGTAALELNDTGNFNTATGAFALFSNTTGFQNTALGGQALLSNIAGGLNTAVGFRALHDNLAFDNTAVGDDALASDTTGDDNTAVGTGALASNLTGNINTAVGFQALLNNTGTDNIALGYKAGQHLTTGLYNIDIGNDGVTAESGVIRIGDPNFQTATYISGIHGQTASGGIPVYVNTDGKLATATSSARFKDEIKPMDRASEAILALKPVTFRYKQELDPDSIPQFGLVAEDVAKVNPDLVVKDAEGKIYTVRYEAVNAMLLNEFLKEHATVQDLKKEIAALKAGLEKVSAQVELTTPAPQTVVDNH